MTPSAPAVSPTAPGRQPLGILWQSMAWGNILITAALVWGLIAEPELALKVLWYALVPLLPAVFLINPQLWRNVCPLATMNLLSGRRWGSRIPSQHHMRRWGVLSVLLLMVLVPARRFMFNENGPVLAVVIVAVALAAFALGGLFSMKAGFCNLLCPVLPVEKLYGQSPLLSVGNNRCATCTRCTPKGCLDLSAARALDVATRPASRSGNSARVRRPGGRHTERDPAWMTTWYGIFSLTFPGAMVGYFLVSDGPLNTALAVYGSVAFWGSAGWVTLTILILGAGLTRRTSTLLIAALCISIYYWFTAPSIATAWTLPPITVPTTQIAALTLSGLWLKKALGGRA